MAARGTASFDISTSGVCYFSFVLALLTLSAILYLLCKLNQVSLESLPWTAMGISGDILWKSLHLYSYFPINVSLERVRVNGIEMSQATSRTRLTSHV